MPNPDVGLGTGVMSRIQPAMRAAAPAGVAVSVTGFEQIQSAGGGGGGAPSVLVETLIGGLGDRDRAVADRHPVDSHHLPAGARTDPSDQRQLPDRVSRRADGPRSRDRLLAAAHHPLARGTGSRPLQRGRDTRFGSDGRTRGGAERCDGSGRAALPRAPAGAVPAQHRSRGDADPARGDHGRRASRCCR